jgi:glyoxalase family protein
MNTSITGIHHVTAIASDPQRNVDFYTALLGLRLVKKTVNFDDPSAYHVYFGDESGTPGSIVTFFYWPRPPSRGRVGVGQVTALTFSAPEESLGFWSDRLRRHNVPVQRGTQFGDEVLRFADPDSIPVEIVAHKNDTRLGWTGAGIAREHALRGLLTVELTVRNAKPTVDLLTNEMGYRPVRTEGNRMRYEAGSGGAGSYVDVIGDATGTMGAGGVGTIHHVAWRVTDEAPQLALQQQLERAGFAVSPVRDRNYFQSIYYRERGGILFEIATDVPGFTVDESLATLGSGLKLPPSLERFRAEVEAALPPLHPAALMA